MNVAIDPRVAATNGRLQRPKSEYTWPGMVAWADWRKTRVRQHTKSYSCAKCGASFASPNGVYAHLDRAHPAGGSRRAPLRLTASDVRLGPSGRPDEIKRSRRLGTSAVRRAPVPNPRHKQQEVAR